MAVTRREFVTTLGLLAGAVGMGQSELSKVVEAFGHVSPGGGTSVWGSTWTSKPKVVWVHGAECTGCSTSLLSLFEDARGVAVESHPTLGDISSATALNIVANGTVLGTGAAATALATASGSHPYGHRTLVNTSLNVEPSAYAVNIADVLIDFIDLQYHETVMAMGGDSAYAYLANEMARVDSAPFVMVVEGAVQDKANGGYWQKPGTANSAPWCSIAKDGRIGANVDLSFDEVVDTLAQKAACKAIVAIGQCASFGGYPACLGPDLVPGANGSSTTTKSMTGAKGVYDFLTDRGRIGVGGAPGARDKVINVPGCPANPWWFTLTVVAWLVDAVTANSADVVASPASGALGILNGQLVVKGGVDAQRRLTAVYGHLLHGKYCPRYPMYAARTFAAYPGDPNGGCLKNIGCKGLSTMSSCGRHGWNNAQPQNDVALYGGVASVTNTSETPPLYPSTDGVTKIGGCCLTAGHPCMGCTEQGYPDAFTPFVTL